MYLREKDLLIVYTKEECLNYLRKLKEENPNYIYSSKDKLFLDKLSKEFNRSKDTVIDYMVSLGMYERKKQKSKEFYEDINVRLDNYLLHIWSKRDESRRDSLEELGEKFGVSYKYVSERVKKLGLEQYKLSFSQISENKTRKRFEDRLECYNKYYLGYKQNGTKISYLEIGYELGFGLRQVISDIKHAGMEEMIGDIKPKMSKETRLQYYIDNRKQIEGNIHIVELAYTVGLSLNHLHYELDTLGIKANRYKPKKSNLYNSSYDMTISEKDFSF